jgi:hypothetical protein
MTTRVRALLLAVVTLTGGLGALAPLGPAGAAAQEQRPEQEPAQQQEPAAEQEPTPVFRTESDLVVLHVNVFDGRSDAVPNLPQNVFEVLEDRPSPFSTMWTCPLPSGSSSTTAAA